MDKKTTLADVAKIFPNATIEESDGEFSLPLHAHDPSLRLVIPEKLPIGMNSITMLPGDIHFATIPRLCQDLGTEFPVWIAAGKYEEGDEQKMPEFRFVDWLATEELLIVARWELNPPVQTASGPDSMFARDYKARALMRIMPPERLGLNQVLPPVPEELSPPLSPVSGLDFWVVERTDFYDAECQMLSENLRQAILLGAREQTNDATRAVCKQLMMDLANEIANDPKLDGWSLQCEDADARLTMKDRTGKTQTYTIFYTPPYLTGLQNHVQRGRDGTLVL